MYPTFSRIWSLARKSVFAANRASLSARHQKFCSAPPLNILVPRCPATNISWLMDTNYRVITVFSMVMVFYTYFWRKLKNSCYR